MAANGLSWLIVCAFLAISLTNANIVRRDIQRIRGGGGDGGENKNATSSMYFQQLFGKADGGSGGGSGGQVASGAGKNVLHYSRQTATTTTSTSRPTLMAAEPKHPHSIQAVNATVHGGNLTSSETVNYYGYEPSGTSTGWMHGYVPVMNVHTIDDGYPATGNGINKRHVHYPPVPMDVINADDDSQNDDGDYNDDDDPDDSDDYDGDGGDGDRASDSPGASDGGGGDGDGEVKDPRQIDAIIREVDDGISTQERDEIDDFDPSATFAIPSNIDPNTPGCKTVYKAVQNGPGKVKSIDNDDFDGDFTFRRRKREVSSKTKKAENGTDIGATLEENEPHSAATSASFVLARECHFVDEGGNGKDGNSKKHTKAQPPPLPPTPYAPHSTAKKQTSKSSLNNKINKKAKNGPIMGTNWPVAASSATEGASINSPITITTSVHPLADSPAEGPIPQTASATSENNENSGIASKSGKATGESRYVPINADPWRESSSRGNFGDRSPRSPYYPTTYDDYKGGHTSRGHSAVEFPLAHIAGEGLSSSSGTSGSTTTLDGEGNTQHFHKYPYPHYHIYYNRPASTVLDEGSASYGSRDPLPAALPVTSSAAIPDGDDTTEDDGIYDSPSAYFEFTNPNGGDDDNGGYQADGGQDDDDGGDGGGDGGEGDGGDNADGDDDSEADDENVGLAASPAESVTTPTQASPNSSQPSSSTSSSASSRSRRVRRSAGRGYGRGYHHPSSDLPLPPTLSPSYGKKGKGKGGRGGDDTFGWAVSGPNFYKSGKFENGDGKKKPKKYTYNYFQREDPDRSEDRDDIYDGDEGGEDGFSKSRPEGRASSRSMKFNVPLKRSTSKRSSSLMADPGDYLINYGSGTFKEYDHEYDSDKDKRLKAKLDKDNYDRKGGGSGGYGDNQAENDDAAQDDDDDGSYEGEGGGDNSGDNSGDDGQYHDDQGGQGDGGHGGQDQSNYADDFDF